MSCNALLAASHFLARLPPILVPCERGFADFGLTETLPSKEIFTLFDRFMLHDQARVTIFGPYGVQT